MNVAIQHRRMTRAEFFDWAQAREDRYEFDGFQPVAMVGGTLDHSQIAANILAILTDRLRGSGCRALGSDAGVSTIGDAVRYPDVLVTCGKAAGTSRLAPGVVIVFEVLSPSSARVDRIEKVREYAAVPTIRRYVIVEHGSVGATVLSRGAGGDPWTATALTAGETLDLPEIAVDMPLAELYEGTDAAAGQG